ncbi:hypothetical protein ABFZ85_06290 [Hyphococcus formosus]|uniref:SEL1-like repeat protein n=1 Tax=Hyphococcus formosus TaxID=3143534 RepID=UPI00398AFEC7
MKSNAPWSVKGIERDARETAKEAARREGMTVGEWLNKKIYSHGQESNDVSEGEVEGLKLRDLVTAIEHLRNRVVEAENRNNKMVTELSRNVGGFVERIQRLERVKPEEGSYQDLLSRVERVERATGDRSRIEALKALEKAVAQVAVQFNNAQKTTLTRLDSAEQQLQEFAARIDKVGETSEPDDVNALKSAIEDLAQRVSKAERIAEEAAQLKDAAADSSDPEFVERTGARLRVLGDEIKRGGDQIRSLENTIAKLSGQIEAAEKRSSEGVQKVADTIAEVRTQLLEDESNDGSADVEALLESARKDTEARIEELQRSLEEMNARFEEIDRVAADIDAAEKDLADIDEPAAEQVADDLTDAFDETLEVDFEREADLDAEHAAEEIEDEAVAETDDEVSDELGNDDVDAAIDDIEEAVAALDLDDDADNDPFAFADTPDEEAPETEAAADAIQEEDEATAIEDISFELDDEADDDVSGEADDEISVHEEFADNEEPAQDEKAGHARALLAEVRDALTGDGLPKADTAEEETPEGDDDLSAQEEDETSAADDRVDEDDDEQAPNTASLNPDIVGETATTTDTKPVNKDEYLKAARQRAKEASAERATTKKRPSLAHLTAKQRAILAARARQKRAQLESKADERAETAAEVFEGAAAVEAAFEARERRARNRAAEKPETTTDAEPTGRFSKLTAALSSARSRLSKKKGEKDETPVAPEANEEITAPTSADETAETDSRNNDREAFESLQANSSTKPVAIALGVAILLAVAALAYLMKDMVFKPGAETRTSSGSPAAVTEPVETTSGEEALVSVPEAPAIDPQAVYLEAMSALSAAEDETAAGAAISQLQDAAALGFPPAQLQLGELYKSGQGVDQDLGQARVWFRRAANGGNVLAMHRIGVMTARGDGGPADSQEAIAWFERAGNYGLVDSQYNLGAIYHPTGDSTSTIQDAAKAYYWYALAARNGDAAAEPLAAGVAVALSESEKAAIDQQVAAWTANETNADANLNSTTG